MRRLIPLVAIALLTACASSTPAAKPQTSPAATSASPTSTGTPSPSPAASTAANPVPSTAASASSSTGPAVAIPAGNLPYKPAPGAPALDDVTVTRSDSDPCGIPADDSGNEAQLLNAERVGNVLVVTFEFTNPCPSALAYDFTVTQAIGSATGPTGGPALQATTPVIQPGASVSFNINVDPSPKLTSTQLRKLWVGVTRIIKHPGA